MFRNTHQSTLVKALEKSMKQKYSTVMEFNMLTVICTLLKMPIELREIEMQRSELIISLYFCNGHENVFRVGYGIIKDVKAEETNKIEQMGVSRLLEIG